MKVINKIIALFVILNLFTSFSFSEINKSEIKTDIKKENQINFIYLHGSNCNTQKDFDKFKKQISKLHRHIIKNFNQNETVNKYLLEEKTLSIDEEPNVFLWGDRSKIEINMLSDLLDVSKLFSPKLAQLARSIFAHCMHDAIWVQNYYNMAPILEDLHKIVLEQQSKGNKVVLFGYSAGTFITLKYIMAYSPLITPKTFLKNHVVNLDEEDYKIIDSINIDNTCLNALLTMDSLYLKENEKDVKARVDKEIFIDEYSKLNEKTKTACYNNEQFKGVINFGSPIFLFSSSLTNPQTELGQFSRLILSKYVSNGHFWLSLNFKEDPLGFSDDTEYYSSIIQNYLKTDFENKKGFIYDNSTMTANRLFITAHYAYLTRYKLFAKNIAKAFSNAYDVFYQLENTKEK